MAFGFIKDAIKTVGSVFSGGADEAALESAGIQSASADKAIALQRETRDLVRADLQPFREAGQAQLDPLSKLISDPQAQLSFIQDNPFFTALANDAQSRLFSNQAARGKVGSGGTAQALQNSLLLLGQDLLNQNIQQRQGFVNMGQAAAAGQATATQQSGNAITDLITQQGNALASGQVGAANARAGGIQNLIGAGTAAYLLSDIRAKTDMMKIGITNDGFNVYRFRYHDDPEIRIGVMAHEVEKVKPEAVITLPNGYKAVNYSMIGA